MDTDERLRLMEKKIDKVLELLGHGGPKSQGQIKRERDDIIRRIENRNERSKGNGAHRA